MKDYAMYILVNEDIKIGKGKLAGQVGHAVASYFYKILIPAIYNLEIESERQILDDYMKVQKKIILYAPQAKLEELERSGSVAIRDKGWTQLEPNTLTCVNIGIRDKDLMKYSWVNDLKLV